MALEVRGACLLVLPWALTCADLEVRWAPWARVVQWALEWDLEDLTCLVIT